MNKNDFYKQLMSEYSFDSEKIRTNAKKGRFAKQKALPLYIGMTAAAAVCTVALGTVLFSGMGQNHGVSLVQDGGLAALSATQRLERALDEIRQNADNAEKRDVLVSFTSALSPSEVQTVLTSCLNDSVPVKHLCFADGTRTDGVEQVAAVFSEGTGDIVGAVINCAGSEMAALQRDVRVFAVENVTDKDIENLTPIKPEEAETSEVVFPDITVTEPDEPVVPNNPITEPQTAEAIETEETEETEETTQTEETSESAETEDTPATAEPSTAETDEPSTAETNEPEPDNPQTEIPAAPALPEGVVLPENVEEFVYQTDYVAAESAYFISDKCFFVKTDDAIELYTFEDGREKLVAQADCLETKVVWISENGARMIVSGTDGDRRTKLFYIDANSGTITDLNAEDMVMDGTLTGVGYNEEANLLALNIKENGCYYVCTATLGSNGTVSFISTCFESEAKVTLLCAKRNTVYLAVQDGMLTQIFRVSADGRTTDIIKTYDNNPRMTKNLAFTHGVISPSENAVIGFVEIFDPNTESFIATDFFSESISFGASRHSFAVNNSCYTISGGAAELSGGINVIGKIEYKKSLSSLYVASANNGCVRITKSIYTNAAKTELLTFGELSDSANTEMRAAVNGAIAMANALAQDGCKAAGITTADQLSQCIGVYYAENAAAELKNRCGISSLGAMKYSSGGLTAINVSDTVLVISSSNGDSASGVLYIKAGSFGGKTAYISRSVKLAKENGSWKLDCIIE